jgi:parallel beta-helix repeat protein
VGQSQNIVVRRNRAAQNVAGIEIENSIDADVYENETRNNAGGTLVFSLPNLPAKNGRGCRVFKNEVIENNHENFAGEGNIVAMVPAGTGLMIMAYDDVEVFENKIENNGTVNVAILSYLVTEKKYDDPDYDAYPEGVSIHHNAFAGGGDKPAGKWKVLSGMVGGKFPDIAYDGIVDDSKLEDGKLPPALRISIHDNGDADFANLDLANFDPLRGKLPKISRDLAPHTTPRTALRPVELKQVQ